MGKSVETDEQDENSIRKVKIPKRLCDLLEEVAEIVDASPKWCLGMLMMRVDHLAHTRPDLLGFEFERALERQQKRATRVIDVAKLHRSEKTKSGFVGVYANGKGFTAMGKASIDNNEQKSLGTYPTAAQAAEARRQHYLKHGIPYGALAERIETFKQSEEWKIAPDELKRRQAIYELAREGTIIADLPDEDRVWETRDPLSVGAST